MRCGIDKGDHYFGPRFVGVVVVWKDLGSGGDISSFLDGASFTSPQPISNQPVELGFPHRVWRFRPGGCILFSCPVCWSCRSIEEIMKL